MPRKVQAQGLRHEPPAPPPPHPVRSPAPWGPCGGLRRTAILDALRPLGTVASFRRGRQIFAEGEPADQWYWLASGAVQVCGFAEDGRRRVAELILPGDLFGFESDGPRGATAEAARDVVVVAYPRARVEAMVDADPRLARAFRQIACGRLRLAQAHLLRLGGMSALARVASFLLEMADRCGSAADRPVELPVTRDDIGDYLGLSSETVSRALTKLRRRGAVALPARQSIRLADRVALADVEGAGR